MGSNSSIDITSFSRDGTMRTVYGYRAVRYEIPRGCVAGYMSDLNILCGIADISTQSEQPVTKHLVPLLRSVVGRGVDASVPRDEKQHAY